MRSKLALMALAVVVPSATWAQFDFGGGATSSRKPWDEFRLNSKTRVKLDFRNSGIDSILSFFQKQSGVTIVKDPSLTGSLNLTSARAVPLSEAFSILQTTLGLKNYDLQKDGNLLVIRQRNQRPNTGFDPSIFQGGGDDRGGRSSLKIYPIKYANASQLARTINDVYQTNATPNFANFQGGRGGNRGGNQGGNNRFNFGRFGGFGQQQPQVRASADDFSNSVIINAEQRQQDEVASIIKQLDKPADEPQRSKVYRLTYASASDTASVIQNVLNANVPRGRGGATTTQNQGPQAFINALRGNTAGAGQVIADSRTNTVVVTATDENLEVVDRVVKELDQEVNVESSTFVFTLQNARADVVSTLIQSAFGTRQGVNTNTSTNLLRNQTGRVNQNGNSNRTGSNNRSGLGNSLPSNGEEYAQADPGSMKINLKDPNATEGELATEVSVTQGFGGQFRGNNRFGGNNSQNDTTSQGRGANGQLINVNDLTGQVTIVPDVNTNSVIVVTAPQNAAIIRGVLEQLDRIPEQVMIETMIVEATLGAADKLGVEFNYTTKLGGILNDPNAVGSGGTNYNVQSPTDNSVVSGLKYTITGTNLTAFINALKTDSKFQVLSTPRIFTSNNVQAEINISQSIPYILSTIQSTTNGSISYNYAFTDVGIVLTVTPRITSNGYVTMDVTQTANDLQGYTSFNAPIVNQREADTTVSVRDGETVVLGGIIRRDVTSTVNKVPLLGDIPILGNLFRSTTRSNNRTELLVFLTPHVVRDAADAQRLRLSNENQLSPENRKVIGQFRNEGNRTNLPGTGPKTPEAKPGTPPMNGTPGSGTSGTGTPGSGTTGNDTNPTKDPGKTSGGN